MKPLFDSQDFAGLGPSRYQTTSQLPPVALVEGSRTGRLRVRVRQECPRGPGVYGMLNHKGELIYVGKSKNLRARLLSYFRTRGRDRRVRRIVSHTRALVWEPGPHEFGALLRELELIRRWRPRFNIQGQPLAKRRLYLCVGRQPAPYCFLASKPPCKATTRFGPIPAGIRAREAVRQLNDWYRLRDCPQSQVMAFQEQGDLFPVLRTPGCLRSDLGKCLAPCAGTCTKEDYLHQVKSLMAFLNGKDQKPIKALARDMQSASKELQFERAAALRDQLERLIWLDRMLDKVRTASEQSFVYRVRNPVGGEIWYLIERGRVRRVIPRPQDETGLAETLQVMAAVYGNPRQADPLGMEEMDSVLLVAAWFRKYQGERKKTMSPLAARELLGEATPKKQESSGPKKPG